MQNFKKILFLLSSRERKQAILLLIMIIIMALLDTLGVASILPFMSVMTNSSIIETNSFLKFVYEFSSIFGVENKEEFLFALGFLVFIILVISIAFKALTTYVQIRFTQMREFSIAKRLVEGYLHQPYSWFLNHNSSDIGKNILSEVGTVVGKGIKPLIELIAKSIVAIAIISLLIITNPKLAFIVAFSLGSAYWVVFYFTKHYLDKIGKKRLENNVIRYLTIMEAFGASKEVKFGGLEEIYINKFSNSAQILARTQASASIIGQLPRFFLEAISFGGILIVILYIISKTGSFNDSLPILSLYIFAGYRLMPAMQQIYASFTQLIFAGPSIDKLYYDINNIKPFKAIKNLNSLPLNKEITLRNIFYSYPNAPRAALKNINLSIPVKNTVGLVLLSGKTTTVDIILGLLKLRKVLYSRWKNNYKL